MTQYGWLGVILGAIGIYYALVSPNQNWRWLAATLALYLLFALTYSAADSALYLIPVWMFGAWAIARGLLCRYNALRAITSYALLSAHRSASRLPARPRAQRPDHIFPAMNLRDDHAATDFANEVLTTAPPEAIVITENDGHTFALWYHRHVAGQRPDLAIVDRAAGRLPVVCRHAARARLCAAAAG